VIFIHTGTGIDIQLFQPLFLSLYALLATRLLVLELIVLEGFLQHLRLQRNESAYVGYAGSLAILGLARGAWLISDECRKNSLLKSKS
jgi:hypothetical protein